MLSRAVTRLTSNEDVMRYVLPVLWMMSCFLITYSNVFPTYSPGDATLFDLVVVHNGANCMQQQSLLSTIALLLVLDAAL